MIGMHAFTGCDTVSAFSGRRKMTTFRQVKMDKAYQIAFQELGRSWEVSPELFEKLQEIHLPHVPAIYVLTQLR